MAVSACIAIRRSGLDRGRGLFALFKFREGDRIHAERPQMILSRGGICPDCSLTIHENPCDEYYGSSTTRSWFDDVAWKSTATYPTMTARLILRQFLSGQPEIPDWLSTLQSAQMNHINEVHLDWKIFIDIVQQHIRPGSCSISDLFPFETFARVLGVVHLNSIEIADRAVVVPKLLALMNHSCDPNVQISDDFVGGNIESIALKDINPGDELRISYVDPNLSWQQRRSYLYYMYGFKCDCRRCLAQQ